MPRVKIDYIVSFSSEDPDNQANNLLLSEVSKRRWLCRAGEPSCSVVLQLSRSVQISAVHVGAHHAALVEVLVGRSETPNEPFQVLVPSCVFVGPAESRRDAAVDRVRSFTADQLAPAAAQRWDRVRLVCSQPYNKHCKYGLSFVHVYSPEEARAPPAPASPRPEDEDEGYRPGQLFARARAAPAADTADTTDTGAQIRRATSQALKNITDSSTTLVKTPIAKQKTKRTTNSDETAGDGATSSDRGGDRLAYTADDDRPHDRIDRLLHATARDGDRDGRGRDGTNDDHRRKKTNDAAKQNDRPAERRSDDRRDRAPRTRPGTSARPPAHGGAGGRRDDRKHAHKRARSADKHDSGDDALRAGPWSAAPHALLAGARVVLSGYVHPLRARVRRAALALGAAVLPAWGPAATHLVCAFPNTPKLREVRAGPGGQAVPAATADWVLQTAALRRALPWQWFATEPARRLAAPADWQHAADADADAAHEAAADESDTDDEIERAVRAQKRARRDSGSTDEDTVPWPAADEAGGEQAAVPDVFAGRTFVVSAAAAGARGGALLPRYIVAHGGLLAQGSAEDDEVVDYAVCAPGERGGDGVRRALRRVPAAWVWRCHDEGRLLPPGD